MHRLNEQLAALRSEKEILEATLFDANTHLEENDMKRAQLEKDLQELLLKHEAMKGIIKLNIKLYSNYIIVLKNHF